MAMDIKIHSARSADETVSLIALEVNRIRRETKDRFWFSWVYDSSELSKSVALEEYNFIEVSTFSVRDNAKEFDGLDEVARRLRNAIGENAAIVTYGDTSKLFPTTDYTYI